VAAQPPDEGRCMSVIVTSRAQTLTRPSASLSRRERVSANLQSLWQKAVGRLISAPRETRLANALAFRSFREILTVMRYCWLFAWVVCSAQIAWGEGLPGWQGLRVIHQEGSPDRMLAAELHGDGREHLIVVNTRHSRLDLYHWLPRKERSAAMTLDPQRPNELPLAPEWSHTEIAIDELPADVIAHDLDGDKLPELLVFSSAANKIFVFGQDAKQQWKKRSHWDLLSGTATGRGRLMLPRKLPSGDLELLISYEQGIQTLALKLDSRPSWLVPRESRGRLDWKLADLDGDGDDDLLEWSSQARQAVRWYECVDGKLLAPQVLHEQPVQGFGALVVPRKPAELLLLGGAQEGLLRRYILSHGEETDLGKQESLPIAGGLKAAWCGMKLGDRPALVAVDPSQPRLRVHELGTNGWLAERNYPTVSGVKALVAPLAKPGTLLLWAKDAGDLHVSRWESNRLSYPEPMPQSADVEDRRIVALESVGSTTWWAQRVGTHLDLYVWESGQEKPEQTRFSGAGTKVEKVVWLGGKRVLLQQAYSNAAKLAVLKDGKTVVTEPTHLGKVDLSEFGLFPRGKELRLGRLTDGVLQWLGEDLHPLDQIMLSDGQRIASYLPLPDGQAWAMEQGGAFIHRLKPDDAGIPRVASSIKPPHGIALRADPVLGLMLIDQDRVIRLSRGRPWELKLVDSIDSRVGRPSGVREATIHRFLVTDVNGDGQDDVVLCDDRRHQLTVLDRTKDGLKPLISWQVFEDQKYPYGEESETLVTEPRVVLGFNADGDSGRDLAMLSHDRLLIYVLRELE
jgi:hypothetical protein